MKSSSKLPAQPEHQNVSAITLRSGKELPSITPPPAATPISRPMEISVEVNDKEEAQKEIPPLPITQVSTSSSPSSLVTTKAPFSNRLAM